MALNHNIVNRIIDKIPIEDRINLMKNDNNHLIYSVARDLDAMYTYNIGLIMDTYDYWEQMGIHFYPQKNRLPHIEHTYTFLSGILFGMNKSDIFKQLFYHRGKEIFNCDIIFRIFYSKKLMNYDNMQDVIDCIFNNEEINEFIQKICKILFKNDIKYMFDWLEENLLDEYITINKIFI